MAFESVQFGLQSSDVVGFTPQQRTAIEMQVTFSVVSEASWLYKNFKLPRYRNSYGYAQIMSGAFVVETVPLQYLNQEILFWEDPEWSTGELVICGVKAVGENLSPPKIITGFHIRLRQRYTSIRFRLYSGVQANVGLRWVTGETVCGNAITDPPNEQGNPIPPNNGAANPSSRPLGQGGDPKDGSDNDGNGDPSDGKPPAPATGDGSAFPHWHLTVVVALPPSCTPVTSVGHYPAFTDPNVPPIYVPGGSSACSGTTFGVVSIGDVVLFEPDDIVSIQSYFY